LKNDGMHNRRMENKNRKHGKMERKPEKQKIAQIKIKAKLK